MAKTKLTFHCTACGSDQPKWAGQCPDCRAWNTIEEFRIPGAKQTRRQIGYSGESIQKVTRLSAVTSEKVIRYSTEMDELDRVLGGGLVPGSVVL
ncbi:MAG: DNA repair protein RadA/Sms, partial [Bacteroidia bacterium]